MNNDIDLNFEKAKESFIRALGDIMFVNNPKGLANYLIKKVYFKNVYGLDADSLVNKLKEEQVIDDTYFDITKNMGVIHKKTLISVMQRLSFFLSERAGYPYDTVKSGLYGLLEDLSVIGKKNIKDEILKSGSRSSVSTDLMSSVLLELENQKIVKEEKALDKEKQAYDKFYEEQEDFISYEESVHKKR